jgi:Flp pilus assembly pilin Flp
MSRFIARLVQDEQGQDLIEYVLIGSFVSIGALTGATLLGTSLNDWYLAVRDWVDGAADNVGGAGVAP